MDVFEKASPWDKVVLSMTQPCYFIKRPISFYEYSKITKIIYNNEKFPETELLEALELLYPYRPDLDIVIAKYERQLEERRTK